MKETDIAFLPITYPQFVSRFDWAMRLNNRTDLTLKDIEISGSRLSLLDAFTATVTDKATIAGDFAKAGKKLLAVSFLGTFDGTTEQAQTLFEIMRSLIRSVSANQDPDLVLTSLKLMGKNMRIDGSDECVSIGLLYRLWRLPGKQMTLQISALG